jgi:dynein light intermediate chain 1, cytosolic
LLKRQPLKPNVIDRDQIVVPPNWDSWGKIRVLREGFDVEVVSNGWSIDLQQELSGPGGPDDSTTPAGSSVALYEQNIRDTSRDALGQQNGHHKLEVVTTDTQEFLAAQAKYLDAYKQKNEAKEKEDVQRVNEHIGPVQFNMGGIQVDADEVVEQMKPASPEPTEVTPAVDTENMQAFFSSLMKKRTQ